MGEPSRPSKEWQAGPSCTRSSRPSPSSARRNAATARLASCWRASRCSKTTPGRRATRSAKRSPATCAAAPATPRSCKRWSLPQGGCMTENPLPPAMPSASPARRGGESADLKVVGKPLPKVDASTKVTGRAVYADDMLPARTLHCKILRSPHPHARILSIDTSAARRIPGVIAVITGADLPIKFGILPVTQDERALEHEKVRYVGDPIAAVAATEEEIAAAACDAIAVEYELLEPVMSIEAALEAPKDERIQDYGGPHNVHKFVSLEFGDVDGAFARSEHVREDVFYAHRGRHPVLMWVRTGVTKDGRITAMHFRTALDGGAYGSYGVASTFYTGALQTVTYDIPAYRFEGCRVFTNKPPCGPKRGHGTPQPRFALELHLEKIARDLDLDPVELKRRNFVKPDTRTVNWLRVTSCGLDECADKVLAASRFRERKRTPGHGMGFAISTYLSGAGTAIYWNDMPHSEVQIKVDRGGVTAYCGAMEIGQGSDSVLATIVAEELGLQPKDVRLVTADSDTTPIDLGSYSSRVTFMAGNAALEAARKMRALLVEAVEASGRKYEEVAFEEAAVLGEARFGALTTAGSYTPPKIA